MQLTLFAVEEAYPAPVATKKKKRASAGWELTDHACRHCMGRVLRRVNPDGVVVVRCAECGASVAGDVESLCCCGEEVRGHGAVFECVRNPKVSSAVPQEILVRERPLVRMAAKQDAKRPMPAKARG